MWKITVLILIVLAAVGAIVYLNGSRAQSTGGSPAISNDEKLVVSPQEARDSVSIDRAVLTKGGFVVVRGSDGIRLGQVIEISKYLEPGEHTNIQIALGDFYTYNVADQLIAMIYRDSDGDQAFSDLDQPAVDASDTMTAVFVKTGKPVPTSVFEEVAVSGGMGMETVRFTNKGFQPSKITVPVGTMVEFVNQSDSKMWVASNVHPSHEILPTFDQFNAVEKGKSYMYTFDKKGTWAYHDHESPAFEGVITVE